MIDTHCHLNDPRFAEDAADAVRRARDNGVTGMLVAGYDAESNARARQLAEHEGVYIALGVHPHVAEAAAEDQHWLDALHEDLLSSPRVASAGEMGLDFHYNHSSPEVQKQVFRAQVRLAAALNLPCTIHSRSAEDLVMDILESEDGAAPRILHAFTGTIQQVLRAVEMGLYIGVTGMITFRRAEELRECIQQVPLDRLLLETDCPYLAPVPHRGKRNEPANIPLVRDALAELLGLAPQEVEAQTTQNAMEVFPRMRSALPEP